MLLELVKQIESGKSPSLLKALREAFSYDIIRVIPIVLIWGLVWSIIVILKALTSKARKGEKTKSSVKDAAMTLSGMNTPFSLWRLGIDMLEKLVRMVVFMALPAVAWENKGSFLGVIEEVAVENPRRAKRLCNTE